MSLIGTIRDPDEIRVRLDIGEFGVRRVQGAISARALFHSIEREPACVVPIEAILLRDPRRLTHENGAAHNARVRIVREHLRKILVGFEQEMAKEIEADLAKRVVGFGWERP